jgi:hypothetical protein
MSIDTVKLNCSATKQKVAFMVLLLTVLFFQPPPEASGVGQMAGGGKVSGSLSLSSGGATGQLTSSAGRVVVTSTPGATDSTDVIDFGDLSTGSGEHVQVGINFLIRGNASYKLNVSESAFTATNLMFHGKELTGGSDQGSFINVHVGAISASGPKANPSNSEPSSSMVSGMTINSISRGPVTASSTEIAQGQAPSIGGTVSSQDNAVIIPIYFSVPSGLELAPSGGASSGRFSVTLQLGVFGS